MDHYVGLDVLLKLTAICIVDRTGKIEREGVLGVDRSAKARALHSLKQDGLIRILTGGRGRNPRVEILK
jgi:hypothetical protein